MPFPSARFLGDSSNMDLSRPRRFPLLPQLDIIEICVWIRWRGRLCEGQIMVTHPWIDASLILSLMLGHQWGIWKNLLNCCESCAKIKSETIKFKSHLDDCLLRRSKIDDISKQHLCRSSPHLPRPCVYAQQKVRIVIRKFPHSQCLDYSRWEGVSWCGANVRLRFQYGRSE